MYMKFRNIYYTNKKLQEAWDWYQTEFEDELEYEDFKKKYPIGSKGEKNFHFVGYYFELLGTLVYEGHIPAQLHLNACGSTGFFKAKKIVEGMRKETDNPHRYENWQYISDIIDEYWVEHQKGKPRY